MSQSEMSKPNESYYLKQLDIIQMVINRMANNSFLLKGWTVTLVAATLLLKGSDIHILIAIIPLITFWALDSYFLWQEKLFRKLFDWTVKNRNRVEEYKFSLDVKRFKKESTCYLQTVFSSTLFLFYGSILLLIVIYILVVVIPRIGG